jgi:predicted N-formylglutamate amidohydrolase
MNQHTFSLLAADEPPPVSVQNAGGASPLLLVADHAGVASPRALGRLGIAASEWQRHIAWDIGIAGLAHLLSDALDATLIRQNYSRLVIDCNRPLDAASSIPEISELTPIPGNVGLSDEEKAARARAIFSPYHECIEADQPAALPARRADCAACTRRSSGCGAAVACRTSL